MPYQSRIILVCLFLVTSLHPVILAQGIGNLDAAWGQQGKLLTDMRITNLFFDQSKRVLAVGDDSLGLLIARFQDNGAFDSSFGDNGKVRLTTGALSSSFAKAVQLPNMQILVLYGKTIFKIKPDGSLVTTFGINGKISISSVWAVNQISLSPNGSIVVSGLVYEDLTGHKQYHPFVRRFLPNGDLDTNFGNIGTIKIASIISSGAVTNTVLNDSRICLAFEAYSGVFNLNTAIHLIMFQKNGHLDSSFAKNGILNQNLTTGGDIPFRIIQTLDNRLLVLGEANAYHFMLVKFDLTGKIDSTFGKNGQRAVTTPQGSQQNGTELQQSPDGQILFAGQIKIANQYRFAAGRLFANGTIDTHFGQMGLVSPILIPDQLAIAHTILLDTIQHKMYLGGVANGILNFKGGVFRFCLENAVCTSDVSAPAPDGLNAEFFPNPAGEILNIRWQNAGDYYLLIKNNLGQNVHQEHLSNNTQHTIILNNLKPGIYWTQVSNGTNTSIQPLIKM